MWSEWISWTDCSGSCGGGRKERSRSCSNPSPQYGGRTCVGDKIVSSICNDQPCPGNILFNNYQKNISVKVQDIHFFLFFLNKKLCHLIRCYFNILYFRKKNV